MLAKLIIAPAYVHGYSICNVKSKTNDFQIAIFVSAKFRISHSFTLKYSSNTITTFEIMNVYSTSVA